MTDAEIIKALEGLSNAKIKYGARKKAVVDIDLLKDALDLIKCQQAEIEVMRNGLIEVAKGVAEAKDLLKNDIANARAEAVKEVVERLKEYQRNYSSGLGGFTDELVDRVLRNAIEIVREGGKDGKNL